MDIKYYKEGKLLVASNALTPRSSERDRHILSMISVRGMEQYDRYSFDNERIIVNVIDETKRMAYPKNIELNKKNYLGVIWREGYFYNAIRKKGKEESEKLIGTKITCPKCKKEITVQWYGIFHACYDQDTEVNYDIDYDLYDLFHLGRYNEQFWKEINDCNV